jgi:protein ImuB
VEGGAKGNSDPFRPFFFPRPEGRRGDPCRPFVFGVLSGYLRYLGRLFTHPSEPRRFHFFMIFSHNALCLWLSSFELRLELLRTPELDGTSVGLISPLEPGGRPALAQVSARAGAAGIQPGMPLSTALSLCPSLTILEPDPAHYGAAMDTILEVLETISPTLEPVHPGLIYVGVDGLERRLGSPERQVHQILEALSKVLPSTLVADLRIGRAPGTFGARAAAAAARPGTPVLLPDAQDDPQALRNFLARQPLEAAPLPASGIDQLRRLGLKTLGEVGALPRTSLVRHFGRLGAEVHARVRGERIDPVRAMHRPRPLRVRMDFPVPTGDRTTLGRALDQLVHRLLQHPERKDRSIRELRLGGGMEGGGSWQVEGVLREPTARQAPLSFLLQTRVDLSPPPRALDTLFVEARAFGAPVTQMGLFDRSESGSREQTPISRQAHKGPGPNPERPVRAPGGAIVDPDRMPPPLREAIRQLRLRIGGDPLFRVVEVDPWSRIPERRYALLPLLPLPSGGE